MVTHSPEMRASNPSMWAEAVCLGEWVALVLVIGMDRQVVSGPVVVGENWMGACIEWTLQGRGCLAQPWQWQCSWERWDEAGQGGVRLGKVG